MSLVRIPRKIWKRKTVYLSVNPSGYDAWDYSYASQTNITNGYADSDNTTYAQFNLTTGSGATTYFYYKFDLSSIPANAIIKSVTCTVKCSISSTNSSYITTRQIQLYSGSTAKGDAATVPNSTTAYSITPGTWTRAELQNARIRLYAVRGTSSTTNNRYFRFYGATLTVEYEI